MLNPLLQMMKLRQQEQTTHPASMFLIPALPLYSASQGEPCCISKSTSSFEANFSHMNLGVLQDILLNFREVLIL